MMTDRHIDRRKAWREDRFVRKRKGVTNETTIYMDLFEPTRLLEF
ncbi:hypothetical protein SANA_13270 [Gottschalkiaceae bacterium SANA]|nr:hypothetical protein SANA_13270 [Gottschalkiaceae bacterium SANA]